VISGPDHSSLNSLIRAGISRFWLNRSSRGETSFRMPMALTRHVPVMGRGDCRAPAPHSLHHASAHRCSPTMRPAADGSGSGRRATTRPLPADSVPARGRAKALSGGTSGLAEGQRTWLQDRSHPSAHRLGCAQRHAGERQWPNQLHVRVVSDQLSRHSVSMVSAVSCADDFRLRPRASRRVSASADCGGVSTGRLRCDRLMHNRA